MKEEQAHPQAEDDEPMLLMAWVCVLNDVVKPKLVAKQSICLNKVARLSSPQV